MDTAPTTHTPYDEVIAEASMLQATRSQLRNLQRNREGYQRAQTDFAPLIAAAQGMYELHKDGVSHQLQAHPRDAAVIALRDALVNIAATTKGGGVTHE
jgi:hypothetical protein